MSAPIIPTDQTSINNFIAFVPRLYSYSTSQYISLKSQTTSAAQKAIATYNLFTSPNNVLLGVQYEYGSSFVGGTSSANVTTAETCLPFWLGTLGNYISANPQHFAHITTSLTQQTDLIFDMIYNLGSQPDPQNIDVITPFLTRVNDRSSPFLIGDMPDELFNYLRTEPENIQVLIRIDPALHLLYMIFFIILCTQSNYVVAYGLNTNASANATMFKQALLDIVNTLRDHNLNSITQNLYNLDNFYSQYNPANIQQYFEMAFFNKDTLYEYDPTDSSVLLPVAIDSLTDGLMKRSYIAQTGYVVRRLYILTYLYYFYYSILSSITTIYGSKASALMIQICTQYLYLLFSAIPDELQILLSTGETTTTDTLGCMMCYQVQYISTYVIVINGTSLTMPAYIISTYSYANNLATTAPLVVNYDPVTYNPGVDTILFGYNNTQYSDPYSIVVAITYAAPNIQNYQSSYVETINERIGLLLLDLSSFPVATSRTSTEAYNIQGSSLINLNDPTTLANMQFLLTLLNNSYLGDNDDITNLVEKNPSMLNAFSYSWNYLKVAPSNNFAANVDFLMRANVTVNGKIVRFVDYVNQNAATNPYFDQINALVISRNIQNATNKTSNQPNLTKGFTFSLSNYYYRFWGIYPHITLKTPLITTTGQYNLLTQKTALYNNLDLI